MTLTAAYASADTDGTYTGFTPYSIYGLGSIQNPGTAYNKTMGGVGVASRNNRFINVINPAGITARDTLSLMIDMSVGNENRIFSQNDYKGVNNTFNITDIAVSFPIYRTAAMALGISPYSSTGYSCAYLYTDKDLIGRTGTAAYGSSGQGSVYQIFASAGVMFWNRLSLGAEWIHYFGLVDKQESVEFSDDSFNDSKNIHSINVSANTLKVGFQYEQPLPGQTSVTVGATYKLDAKMSGGSYNLSYASGDVAVDTLSYSAYNFQSNNVCIPGELAVGVSVNVMDRIRAEFDYVRTDWTKSNFDKVEGLAIDNSSYSTGSTFKSSVSQEFRFGLEIVPNRNDIRYYFKRVAYRVGAYHKTESFTVDGRNITSSALTCGMTLPVFRWSNGITLGAEFGRRGSLKDNLVRETFCNFSIGFNLYDIWFQKFRYD